MTCIVRVEAGVCRLPKAGEVEIHLQPHDFIRYVKEVELQKIPMCAKHLKLIKNGWSIRPSLVYRWVPPEKS